MTFSKNAFLFLFLYRRLFAGIAYGANRRGGG